MSTNYDIDYNDSRFADVEADKKTAMDEVNKTYDNMINESDSYYNAQIDASKEWAETQKKLQQEQTDFTIEKIEQEKEQAKKDYTKEQSGAYVDWQKQSNQYGANAEQMAAAGMQNTGYSESSLVSMYNTYQNRVATARESYDRAILNYNNAITEARLQNNSILAEIAYNALQTELQLGLEGFQYQNSLILDKADRKLEVDNIYYSRYLDVVNQINHENALAEDARQFDETMAFNKSKSSGSGGGGGGGGSGKTSSSKTTITKGKSGTTIQKSGGNTVSSNMKKAQEKVNGTMPKLDLQSVLGLGRGPISESELVRLENAGIVESYESGGSLKFRYTPAVNKQKSLLGG